MFFEKHQLHGASLQRPRSLIRFAICECKHAIVFGESELELNVEFAQFIRELDLDVGIDYGNGEWSGLHVRSMPLSSNM